MTIDQYEADVKRINDEHFETLMRDFDEMEKIAGQPEPEPKVVDKAVNQPNHYQWHDMEVLAVVEKVLTTEEYLGYLKGTDLVYRMRAGKKLELVEDIQKALKYEDFYREFKQRNTPC